MVQAALTPNVTSRMLCSIWMKNQFDLCGDRMPNSTETKLSLVSKSQLYLQYVYEMQEAPISKNITPSPVVTYNSFIAIWNVLHPTCAIRPYVDIPGKCFICGEIDRLRQIRSEHKVQAALRNAHNSIVAACLCLKENSKLYSYKVILNSVTFK